MKGQLHLGQSRYHEFAGYREALEANARKLQQNSSLLQSNISFRVSSTSFNQPLHRTFLTSATARTSNLLTSQVGGLSSKISQFPKYKINDPVSPDEIQHRKFSSLIKWLKLRPLEYEAMQNPNDPHKQAKFLLELMEQNYPEAVIERFETHGNFVVTDMIAHIYLTALQRTGKDFNVTQFVRRLQSKRVMVDISPSVIAELEKQEISSKKDPNVVNQRGLQLATAMDILRNSMGGTLGASSLANGAATASVGAAGANMFGKGGGNNFGINPESPLYVQLSKPTSMRDQMFKTLRVGLFLFFAVSAVGAFLDEKGMSRAIGIGGKHTKEAEGSNVKFSDIKGVDEAKAELQEIVMYLKDPQRFTRLGGKLPRGLLLTGPPGTGKTLLAKAIAGEAGVPFFFSSGSQFEEVYVGLGAKRVRELFEAAKKKSPAIIFIDEIDAVGGSRKLKDQSALKMTLNELLVQMDGFDENNGIIVVGATNFMESLDMALLRPGRFDKHVTVPLPDIGGRKEILEMYAKKTSISKDVDLVVLARGTPGFSGADLYNLMNQAALKASVDGLNSITMEVLEYAKDKIMMGSERKTAVITPESARSTAFHEAGHAVVAVLTEGAMPIHKATIMPRGQALGMVTMLPEADQLSQTYKQLLASMDVSMGGRVAEEIIFGKDEISTGAYSDLHHATRTARNMVTKFGFSDKVGVVHHQGDLGESASGSTRVAIDEEVKRLTQEAYERATTLLKKFKKEHQMLAEALIEYETLTGDEVRDIVLRRKKPTRPVTNTQDGAKGDQTIFGKSKSTTSGIGSGIAARKNL